MGRVSVRPSVRLSPPHWEALKTCLVYSVSDEWTDGRKVSPFYKTSSPTGAAAQKETQSVRPMFNPPQPPFLPTPKPPQIKNFGNFGPIWMKLGGEVYWVSSSSGPTVPVLGFRLGHGFRSDIDQRRQTRQPHDARLPGTGILRFSTDI